MNILHLCSHLNAGGITSYVLTLSKGLIALKNSVHVISSGGNMEKELVAAKMTCVTKNILTKSELNPKIYLALRSIKKYIQDNNINVIHAHTRTTQVMAYWLNKSTRVPFVATCHGFFKPRLSRKLFPCWGDQTVAISQEVLDHVVNDFYISKKCVHVVETGINLERFPVVTTSLKESNRASLNLGTGPVIGMVARLSDVKGQDILLRAVPKIVKEFPDMTVLLVGEGKEKDRLYSLITELKLANYVQVIETHGSIPKYLSILDAVISPSRMEGLGLSVMEAQASGLPVVASRVGGIPSIIVHGKTGYMVEPQDEGALAAMICKVLHNNVDARRVGVNAANYAREHYGSEIMVKKILEVYKKAGAR